MTIPVFRTAVPPKRRIALAFGRRAARYGDNAEVQSELTAVLSAKLASLGLSGGRWVDLGCGIGTFSGACGKNGFRGDIVGVDISFEPLRLCTTQRAGRSCMVQADIDHLPFRGESFDGAVTSSTLQWLENVPDTLKKIPSLLKKRGILAFSVFIEGSFRELFSIQRMFNIPAPVQCLKASAFTAALADAGFEAVEYETVEKTVRKAGAADVLKTISGSGSSATIAKRLLNRKELAEFCGAYEKAFGRGGAVSLTFRAIAGVCRKGRPT